MVADVYSTIIVKVFYARFRHHAEKDDEQSRCQNTTLFHAIDDGEGSREVTVQPNLAVLVFVELDNHAEEWGEDSMIIHSLFLVTVSNTLARSTNTSYSPLFYSRHFFWSCLRMNTMSVVPLLALNSHWVSGRWSSAMVGINLFRSKWARIFPAMKSRVIPWLLEQSDFSTSFLYKVMMTESQRSLGSLLCSQQQTRSLWSLLRNAGPPFFQSSGGILLTPTALPLLNGSMVLVISFREGSSILLSMVNGGCRELLGPGQHGQY